MQEEKGTDPGWFIIWILVLVRAASSLSDEGKAEDSVLLPAGQKNETEFPRALAEVR